MVAFLAALLTLTSPDYSVDVPSASPLTVTNAALELRRYVRMQTGVELSWASDVVTPHRIVVREDATLAVDEFRIKAKGGDLEIAGGGRRGPLYAVYDLLERFGGCVWCTSWYEHVPKLKAFRVPADLDVAERPAFEVRDDFWFDAFEPSFAIRNKLNGEHVDFPKENGGRSEFRFGGGLGNAHTSHVLMPVDEFYAAHPEYYCLRDGRRLDRDWQLCLSNPDVLRIVTERVLERIRRAPGARYYGVSQEDNSNYCTCEKCRAIEAEEGAPSGAIIRFVNAVAEAVEKEFPDKIVETLAYQYSRKPPKTRPRRNVMICLCTSGCDFATPLERRATPGNAAFCDDLAGWRKLTDSIYLWDYVTDFLHYAMPYPNLASLQANVRFFRANGVKCYFPEGAYQGRHGDLAELKAWLLAKWMWNPDLPEEELLTTFFSAYYGAAAREARAYYDLLVRAKPRWLGIGLGVDAEYLNEDFMHEATRIWAAAEKAVKDDPARLYNVRGSAISTVYTRLMQMERVASRTVFLARDPSRYDLAAKARPLVSWLRKRKQESGNRIVWSEYVANAETEAKWDRFLAREPPRKGTGRVVLSERELDFSGKPEHGAYADDLAAADGQALRIDATHIAWCVTLKMDKVTFDPGVTNWTVRLKVRTSKKAGWEAHGQLQAFCAGIYDNAVRRNYGLTVHVREATEDYRWYEISVPVAPADSQYFWFSSGDFDRTNLKAHPAIGSAWIDEVEIIEK